MRHQKKPSPPILDTYIAPEPYLHLLRAERKRITLSGRPKNEKKRILDFLSRTPPKRADFSMQNEMKWNDRRERRDKSL